MNKKILITGASGFIGKILLEFLIQDPKNEITITSRSSKDLLKLKKKTFINYNNIWRLNGY